MNEIFHPVAWLAWAAAAVLLALLTRNPLYMILLLATAVTTYRILQRRSTHGQPWGLFLRIGLLLVAVSAPLNALMAHAGRIVLWRLPESWPLVGGNITGEALLYGLSGGLNLLALLLIFAVFNLGLDQGQLLRLAPKPFYAVGVTTAIAITFTPQMLRALQEIGDVQRLRGHRARGLRSLGPLILPLLTTGLERAIQLAESMEARGFSRVQAGMAPHRLFLARLGLLAALALVLAGLFVRSYWPAGRTWGTLAAGAGFLLLALLFWQQGRQIERTHYRRWLWRRRDLWLSAASGAALAITIGVWLTDRALLVYYPYPPFSPWPLFHPVLGLAALLLIAPALLIPIAPALLIPPGESGKLGEQQQRGYNSAGQATRIVERASKSEIEEEESR